MSSIVKLDIVGDMLYVVWAGSTHKYKLYALDGSREMTRDQRKQVIHKIQNALADCLNETLQDITWNGPVGCSAAPERAGALQYNSFELTALAEKHGVVIGYHNRLWEVFVKGELGIIRGTNLDALITLATKG